MDNFIQTYKLNTEWNYNNKIILAPMVKIGTLPMRMLCREYGADIVYSQEYMDDSINLWERNENNRGTIEYIAPSGKTLFQTYKDEPIAFQIGTADSVKALNASLKVYNDVRAIDINMGCPLKFSTMSGKGAALLKTPEKIKDILTTLKRNLDKPVTCKIRLLDKLEDTIDLIKKIEKCNPDALGIHCRFVRDRSKRERARYTDMYEAVKHVSLPTIVNGDIFNIKHIDEVKEKTGANSVMIARGAIWNPSIFNCNEFEQLNIVSKKYLYYSELTKNNLSNTKHILKSMISPQLKKIDFARMVSKCTNYNELNNLINDTEFNKYKVPINI